MPGNHCLVDFGSVLRMLWNCEGGNECDFCIFLCYSSPCCANMNITPERIDPGGRKVVSQSESQAGASMRSICV